LGNRAVNRNEIDDLIATSTRGAGLRAQDIDKAVINASSCSVASQFMGLDLSSNLTAAGIGQRKSNRAGQVDLLASRANRFSNLDMRPPLWPDRGGASLHVVGRRWITRPNTNELSGYNTVAAASELSLQDGLGAAGAALSNLFERIIKPPHLTSNRGGGVIYLCAIRRFKTLKTFASKEE